MLLIMLADCKCHNIAYAIYIYIYIYIHTYTVYIV